MVQGQVFLKRGLALFLFNISRFIVLHLEIILVFAKFLLHFWRKIIFSNSLILWKKVILSFLKMNLCVFVSKVGVSDSGRRGGCQHQGSGNWNTLKDGWIEKRKRGEGKQKFLKKGEGKLGQGVGALKSGAGTLLWTITYKALGPLPMALLSYICVNTYGCSNF